MADPLQSLMQLVQGGGGQGAPAPQAPQGGAPDIMAQLQALMGGGGGGQMQPPMPSPDAVSPMSRAIQNYTGPREQQPGGYADDALDVPPGTAPNDPAGGRMPGQKNMGAYLNAQSDVGPPGSMGPGDQRLLNNQTDDQDYARHGGVDDWSGQKNMGAYLNGSKEGPGDPKYDQTKAELDDVSKRMGGNPEEDGNFPPQSEIDALNAGKIDPVDFDKKWGKGAAAEMQDVGKGDNGDADDEGDHEYR